MMTSEVERGVVNGVECPEENVEETIPIKGGGDVPLACPRGSLETRSEVGVRRVEPCDTV